MKKKALISLSGGMDSTTALYWALAQGYEVHTVHFQYGSKHNPYEIEAVRAICEKEGLLLTVIDMTSVFQNFSSNLLSGQGAIPEGHYEDATMAQTVVPGRNIIFASVLCGLAWTLGAEVIVLGVHQGDHAIYADCRIEFIKALDLCLFLGSDRRVRVEAPLLMMDKGDIAITGTRLGVPFELTRTCYKAQPHACGKCGACQERLEAFAKAGRVDPIPYDESQSPCEEV